MNLDIDQLQEELHDIDRQRHEVWNFWYACPWGSRCGIEQPRLHYRNGPAKGFAAWAAPALIAS